MNKVLLLFFLIAIGLLLAACSKLESNIEPVSMLSIHKAGINDASSMDFHGKLLKEKNYKMDECRQCHGGTFSGGYVEKSCLGCHSFPGGPEACNTCHGTFDDPMRSAPPKDLKDNVATDFKSVGAHTMHLYDKSLGNTVKCSNCHNVPIKVNDEGHIDNSTGAEVILKGLSVNNIAFNAQYDQATGICSNSYCHGNFEFYRDSAVVENRFAYTTEKMVGLKKSVLWTKVDRSEVQCGSCHGLPPEGHISVPQNSCYMCHQGVIDSDGKIIDISKHINGIANARGN